MKPIPQHPGPRILYSEGLWQGLVLRSGLLPVRLAFVVINVPIRLC